MELGFQSVMCNDNATYQLVRGALIDNCRDQNQIEMKPSRTVVEVA